MRTARAPLPRAAAARWRGAVGGVALAAIALCSFLIAAGLSDGLSKVVPYSQPRQHHVAFTGWLAGPFQGLGITPGPDYGWTRFQILVGVMCLGYAAVLACGSAPSARAVWITVIASHVLLTLGPALLSLDLFGYAGFARMGVLHHLNPYVHTAADIRYDAVYPLLGWHNLHSPYGPLFTLLTYAVEPLGLAGSVWALKALAATASLGAAWLVARTAARLGRSPSAAVAFLALNPVLLVFAVGGGHNDTFVVLLTAAALLAWAARRPAGSAVALVAAIGVKASAGLMLPYLLVSRELDQSERRRTITATALSAAALAVLAVAAFGTRVLGLADALRGQQQMVAVHSLPRELARLLSLHGLPTGLRVAFIATFAIVALAWLVKVARGGDWRSAAGWATLALLLSTAWLLPWYVIWLLPIAAVSSDRRLRAATLAFCAYSVLIRLPFTDPVLGSRL